MAAVRKTDMKWQAIETYRKYDVATILFLFHWIANSGYAHFHSYANRDAVLGYLRGCDMGT